MTEDEYNTENDLQDGCWVQRSRQAPEPQRPLTVVDSMGVTQDLAVPPKAAVQEVSGELPALSTHTESSAGAEQVTGS